MGCTHFKNIVYSLALRVLARSTANRSGHHYLKGQAVNSERQSGTERSITIISDYCVIMQREQGDLEHYCLWISHYCCPSDSTEQI